MNIALIPFLLINNGKTLMEYTQFSVVQHLNQIGGKCVYPDGHN